MEDHLKNKNRLEREWEALCSYQAEPGACSVGQGEQSSKKNRSDAVVVCESIQKSIQFFVLFFAVRMSLPCTSSSILVDVFKELHKTI